MLLFKRLNRTKTVALICACVFAFLVLVPGGFAIKTDTAQAATVSVVTVAAGTRYATPMYVIKSGVPGPVFMVTGGVHGNEAAGYKAADIIKNFRVKKGTLLVIPRANRIAVLNKTRTCTGVGDLNRSFPKSSTGKPDDVLATAIWNVVKKYKVTWLVDLHEGYKFHLQNPSSWGQTMIYYPRGESRTVGLKVIAALNKSIKVPSQRFTLVRYPYPGELSRSTGQFLGVHSFVLESCRKEALSTRVNRHVTAVRTFLKLKGMM